MKLNMMKKVIAIVVLQATILYYLVSAGGCCSGGDANEGVAAVTEHDPYNVDVEANTGHVFDAPSYGYQESVGLNVPNLILDNAPMNLRVNDEDMQNIPLAEEADEYQQDVDVPTIRPFVGTITYGDLQNLPFAETADEYQQDVDVPTAPSLWAEFADANVQDSSLAVCIVFTTLLTAIRMMSSLDEHPNMKTPYCT
ncbi:hypothetical protein SeLEV6574_g08251 [Synchytrium endobioticum]|uniref:Secreted protein n=1 Tax=Synchytrium endobioticum TaxID=286115 RepID=A0A507C616_9FUNG|nr:hypothetical protein SeLEV6574_g08251 [Synchytrium endobioticum]